MADMVEHRAARQLGAILAALGGALLPGVVLAQTEQPAGAVEAENSGQDPTRPVTRLDLRLKLQDGAGGTDSQLLTVRVDKPFELDGGWKISTRADLPIVRNNAAAVPAGADDYETGFGDVLLQALVITPSHGRLTVAFGTQLIIPTGQDDQFTTGKWRLAPTAAVIYQLPEVSRGSFVGVVVRDDFSFAGDDDREDTNVAGLQPIFNWALPEGWFVTLSPEAKFDTRDGWKPFVPFDVTLGRKLNPTTVASVQWDVALIDDYPLYDWQVEFRLGFFF